MHELNLVTLLEAKRVDPEKRTVVAGVLQGETLSANNRYYSTEIVESAVSQMVGKKSFIGHETNSVDDIVAKITSAKMEGPLAVAEFKFGTDTKSDSIFTKIKEGLVDSVSIRASGETKRAKIGENFVDVVESLELVSVDLVPEGGIPAAKVLKVFESKPKVDFNYKKEQDMEAKELQEKLSNAEKSLEAANAKIEEAAKKLKEAEDQKLKAELDAYKNELCAEISKDKVREMVKGSLNADTKEKIKEQFDKQVAYFESLAKEVNHKEPVLKPTDTTNEKDTPARDVNEVLAGELTNEERSKVITSLLG